VSGHHQEKYAEVLHDAKTVVIKMGSALILRERDGQKIIDEERLGAFIDDIQRLVSDGKRIVLVSSGAVGLGRQAIHRAQGESETLEQKQAAASVGNPQLMAFYDHAFRTKSDNKISVGQVLMTPANTREPRRRYNIRNTIRTMLDNNIVPIINENDAVTTYSIRYGDNDSLASYVAYTISADAVILLTDVLGFYENFSKPDQKFKRVVDQVTADTFAQAGGAGTDVGTGGMYTKIKAAKIATEEAGCPLIIACGRDLGDGIVDPNSYRCPPRTGEHNFQNIVRLFSGAMSCTLFKTTKSPTQVRQLDIQTDALHNHGGIVVDHWDVNSHTPILPNNIVRVMGDADRGQSVKICEVSGRDSTLSVIGWGVLEHSLEDVRKIKGLQNADEVKAELGFGGRYDIMKSDQIVRKQARSEPSELLD